MAAKKLFVARNQNGGLIGPYDWTETVWSGHESGVCSARTRFSGCPGAITHKIVLSADRHAAEASNSIRILMEADWKPFTDACDGDAWTFRTYDVEGRAVAEVSPGHIYDCPTLQSIASLLPTQDALIRLMEDQFRQKRHADVKRLCAISRIR